MDSVRKYEVPVERLCWQCNTDEFSFQCTDELAPPNGFIGQDRAIRAIRFGLELDKPGYNLFVTGLTRTGKASAIKSYLQTIIDERKAQGTEFPIYDWCYVHNFADPDRPQMLRLPQGKGKALHDGMEALLRTLREEMPKVFAGENYASQRKRIEEEGRTSYQSMLQGLEREARAESFGLQFSPTGMNLFPLTGEGAPLTPEEFMKLEEAERRAIEEKRAGLFQRAQAAMERMRAIEKDTQDKIRALDRDAGDLRLSDLFRDVTEDFSGLPNATGYLAALKQYTLNNLDLFTADRSAGPEGSGPAGQPPATAAPGGPQLPSMTQRNPFLPFEINVIVDSSDTQAAPIIIESNPTWGNLFGRIERRAFMGTYFSDHTMLKGGSIHHANGGYIVLNVRDLLMNSGVWEGLKRTIRNREARLEDPAETSGLMAPQGLRPQSMPWSAKVIVTGDEAVYRQLSTYDQEDFWEMFKVKAEFDSQIDLTPESVADYCAFICGTCESEELLHCDRSGVARIIEYGARLVADQTRLSTRFGQIKDLLIEADYWARKSHPGPGGLDRASHRITAEHVKRALDEKVYRLNLMEERLRRLISEGTIMINIDGEVVGQANGLVVYDMGDFSFGRPARITTRTFAGRRGVINIEREAQLSGRIHDKGVLILSGYLGWKFAQDKPLSLSASLSFEQSYEGVEGDSASSTELYAILSSLSELPLKQGIAITGSVNQKGEVQPIGGVNQKVEGFYDVCRVAGLTGDQGVIVPHQNVRNLMLRDDVVEAIRAGRFHIYAVKSIDEGIEILTGVPAGERQPHNGPYPQGTVNHLVDCRLQGLAHSLQGFYAEVLGESRPP